MKLKHQEAFVTDVDHVSGLMHGYLSNWDNKDSDGDFTVRGKTFVKTVSDSGPLGKGTISYLKNHNWDTPAGVFKTITEDEKGLPYTGQLTKNRNGVFTPRSEEIIALYDTGFKFNHSYGYKVIQQQKTAQGNMLTEVKLYEGSILTMPGANPLTPVTEMKWDTTEELIERLEEFHKCLEKALHRGNFQDETYQLLQKNYDAIGLALATKQATEPGKSTQPDDRTKADLIAKHLKLAI